MARRRALKLPEPPSDFAKRPLKVTLFRGPWLRIHALKLPPRFFGKLKRSRFDDALGSFGVMYVARDLHGAFVETFAHATGGARVLLDQDLRTRGVAEVRLRSRRTKPLRLVDLSAEHLTELGLDARLTTGDYTLAQRWSRAFYEHPKAPDGLVYRSRHDLSRLCAALFDRAEAKVVVVPLGGMLDPTIEPQLDEVLATYSFARI